MPYYDAAPHIPEPCGMPAYCVHHMSPGIDKPACAAGPGTVLKAAYL